MLNDWEKHGKMYTPPPTWDVPFLIATARCEKIELFNSLNSDRDLEIKAKVVWVGTSSLVIINFFVFFF